MVFRRQTLFIVGAGASAEFGLPVGSGLTQEIATAAEVKLDHFGSPQNASSSRMLEILRRRKDENAQLNIWLKALRQISKAIFLKRSIDSYIDQHADDPAIAEMGKILIAMRILEAERRSILATSDSNNNLRLDMLRKTWIDQFAAMLFDGLRLKDLDRLSENVQIICFNYDRCIEQYLAHAIQQTYSISPPEAARRVDGLSIIHPYGSLGPLSSVPFGAERYDYWKISENLKTFSESADSNIENQIKLAVQQAEQYVFLGFSFGRQNMELLSLRDFQVDEHKDVYASGFGLFKQAVGKLSDQIEEMYGYQEGSMIRPIGSGYTNIEVDVTARLLLDIHWHNIMAN